MQLRLLQKNKEEKDMIIAVAGSGGKTTRVHKLAQYYRSLGKKVFVTTTTHMKKESDTVIPENIEDIRKQLNETGYCMAGMPATPENALVQKIGPLPEDFYETAVKEADITLIEADGSRGMPAKIPADYEPVIPENIDEIHIVIGMSALGKLASKVVHRLSLADKDLEIKEDTILTPLHLQKLLKKGYLGPLREQYKDTKIKVYPGQADTLYQRVIARFLQEEKDVAQIKDDWFKIQPKLVIFGAGHVAIQLLRIAKFLDFYTIMIDDREEFADPEKLSQADEVYCRDFHDIEDILPEQDNAFYVVVTCGINEINAQAKISTRLASLFGAILYFSPISFAIGQVTIIAIVLFTIAAERIPDISPIPYSAPRLFLILPLIAPTSHSTPPYSRTIPMIPDTKIATILILNISLIPFPIA